MNEDNFKVEVLKIINNSFEQNKSTLRIIGRWLLAVVIVLGAVLAIAFNENQKRINDIEKTQVELATTHDAVCNLQKYNISRLKDSEKFIKEHPKGIPGIPVKTIKDDIKKQHGVIKSLSPLRC